MATLKEWLRLSKTHLYLNLQRIIEFRNGSRTLTVLPIQIDVCISTHNQIKAASHIWLSCCHHKIVLVVEWQRCTELKLRLAGTLRIICDHIRGRWLRIELMHVEIAVSVEIIGAGEGVELFVDVLDSDDFIVVEVRSDASRSSELWTGNSPCRWISGFWANSNPI